MKTLAFEVSVQGGVYSSTNKKDPTDVLYGYRIDVSLPDGRKHTMVADPIWKTRDEAKAECRRHANEIQTVLRDTFADSHHMVTVDRSPGSSDPAPEHAPVVPDGVNGVKDGVIYV